MARRKTSKKVMEKVWIEVERKFEIKNESFLDFLFNFLDNKFFIVFILNQGAGNSH